VSDPYIPKALRAKVAAQARHRCGYCLTSEAIVGTPMEIDHIIPQSLGGLTEEDNLWLACSLCNDHSGGVRRNLLALPGIGPYAAAALLGLLGRCDYIGVDTEATSAVSKASYGGRPVGEKEVNAVFARWGKYKALAYWFWDFSGQQQSPMDAWEVKAST